MVHFQVLPFAHNLVASASDILLTLLNINSISESYFDLLCFRYVRNEALIQIGKLHFKAFHVPGHTAGHIIYALQLNDELKCLFTGDFLFIAGIGIRANLM